MKPTPSVTSNELTKLLERLGAGADQQLFTVNDWALRLGERQLAQQFVEQLRQEWQPLPVPDGLCQEMMNFSRAYLSWYLGWPHLWAHILRVTATMLALAPESGVDPAHAFMLGMFHDIGKLDEMSGGDDHELIGAELLAEQLAGHYSRREIILMTNVIAKKSSALNPYTQVLQDADKLDKVGATGILRRVSTRVGLEHTRYALGRVKDDAMDLPAMHFPTSRDLGILKLKFTQDFLVLARSYN